MTAPILRLLADLVLVLAQLGSAAGLGLFLLSGKNVGPREDRMLVACGLGLLVLGLLTFLGGLAGLLRPWFAAGLWASGIGLGMASWDRTEGLDSDFWSSLRRERSFLLLFSTCAGANLFYAYGPPLFDDSVYFNLANAQAYALAHRVHEIPQNAHAYMPALVEMLYAQMLLFGGPETAKLVHWAFGLLCALATARLAWRWFEAPRPALIGTAWYAMPWVCSLTGTGKVDLGSTWFWILSVHAFFLWRQARRPGLLALTGLLAGAHLATKMTASANVLLLGGLVLYEASRRDSLEGFRGLLLYLWLAALPMLPWLVRNAVLKGNPFYPAGFLGLPGDYYLYAFLKTTAPQDILGYVVRTLEAWIVGDLIWGAGPLLWAGLPPAFLEMWRRQDGAALKAGLLAVGGAVAVLVMFPGAVSIWYVAPACTLLAAVVLAWLSREWAKQGMLVRCAVWLSLLLPGVALPAYMAAKRLPVSLGLETREQFLQRNWKLPEDYETYRYVTEHLPKGSSVFFAYQDFTPALFYPDHRTLGIGLYPPAFASMEPLRALGQLQAEGVRYLVYAPQQCQMTPEGACCLPVIELCISSLRPEALRGRLRLLFLGQRSAVYQILG